MWSSGILPTHMKITHAMLSPIWGGWGVVPLLKIPCSARSSHDEALGFWVTSDHTREADVPMACRHLACKSDTTNRCSCRCTHQLIYIDASTSPSDIFFQRLDVSLEVMEPSPEDLVLYKALRRVLGRILRLVPISGTALSAKAATRPQQKTTRTFGDREHVWSRAHGVNIIKFD